MLVGASVTTNLAQVALTKSKFFVALKKVVVTRKKRKKGLIPRIKFFFCFSTDGMFLKLLVHFIFF